MAEKEVNGFAALAERLMVKNEGKQSKELNKTMEGLNKSILSLAKKIIPKGELGNTISGISAARKTYDPVSEMIKERLFPRERSLRTRFGTMRDTLNTVGIVKKDSGSIFDRILDRRDARTQFIKDQLLVNPQMANTKKNRETFGKKFDQQQILQRDLNKVQSEIDRLKEAGFTDKQIARSGLVKKRDNTAANLAASDNRLYETIKEEISDSIKEGLVEGIKDAALEAERKLNEFEKGRKFRDDPLQSTEEREREDEQIQEGILKFQKELVEKVQVISDLLDKPAKEKDDKKEPGWLSNLLSTISGFFMGKITGLVGMLTSGISAVISPLLKLLGIGKGASVAASTAANVGKVAAGAAVAKSTGVLGKAKSMIRAVAPKIGSIAKVAGSLLLAKPALIAATVAGAGYLGYSMLPEDVKENIDNKIAKFLGNDTEEPVKIAKKETDEQTISKIERASVKDIGEVINQKVQEVKNISNAGESSTIINAPSNTTNNQNSVVNNHFRQSPRNSETTFNRYVSSRFSPA